MKKQHIILILSAAFLAQNLSAADYWLDPKGSVSQPYTGQFNAYWYADEACTILANTSGGNPGAGDSLYINYKVPGSTANQVLVRGTNVPLADGVYTASYANMSFNHTQGGTGILELVSNNEAKYATKLTITETLTQNSSSVLQIRRAGDATQQFDLDINTLRLNGTGLVRFATSGGNRVRDLKIGTINLEVANAQTELYSEAGVMDIGTINFTGANSKVTYTATGTAKDISAIVFNSTAAGSSFTSASVSPGKIGTATFNASGTLTSGTSSYGTVGLYAEGATLKSTSAGVTEITTLSVGAGASKNTTISSTNGFNVGTTEIKSATNFTVSGGASNLGTLKAAYGVALYASADLTIESVAHTGGTFLLNSGETSRKVSVKNNYTVSGGERQMTLALYYGGFTIEKNLSVASNATLRFRGVTGGNANPNTFVIQGSIENNGKIYMDDYYVENGTTHRALEYSITAGGIKGGDGTTGVAIYMQNGKSSTEYYGNLTLRLNGDATEIYSSRISDFDSAESDLSNVVQGSKINLHINSANGDMVQYLTGQNFIRGSVTVESGTLHLRADGKDNAAKHGVGDIFLKGGALSAVGAGTTVENAESVGVIKGENMTWSGGRLMVDIANGAADKIDLNGIFGKDGDGLYEIDFAISQEITGGEFVIASFISTTFDKDDFTVLINGIASDKIELEIREGKELVAIYNSVIPEPAHYAAVFGLITLLFAVRRKKQK